MERAEAGWQTILNTVMERVKGWARMNSPWAIHFNSGSCNGCEIEISGLTGPVYDSERFGIHFVATPRHADMLLVTGPVTRNMEVPLRKTYDATPDPKMVVAAGDCAQTCGVFKGSYAVAGSVDRIIPVNIFVHGCPPEPADILRGILAALHQTPGKA